MGSGRCLVVFYSRTGNTRKVAEQIAQGLGCETEALTDLKPRAGALGFLKGGGDAFRKRLTQIGEVAHNPADFELVVLGTPVWASTMAPAMRTYLTEQAARLPQVAFFVTTGSTGIERTFRHMEEMCGKAPKATLGLLERDVRKGDPSETIRAFVEKLRA
jgi:flavodoxin